MVDVRRREEKEEQAVKSSVEEGEEEEEMEEKEDPRLGMAFVGRREDKEDFREVGRA